MGLLGSFRLELLARLLVCQLAQNPVSAGTRHLVQCRCWHRNMLYFLTSALLGS